MIITKEWIMNFRTERGAWTRVQIESLGIEWPAKKGWITELLGAEIGPEQAKKFELGRSETAEKVRSEGKKKDMYQSAISQVYWFSDEQLKRLALIISKEQSNRMKLNGMP